MKYSINGTGNIVAERDIYSLGGFIPKGRVGGKIASKAQLSQDGECWLAGGDISARPDVRIKDNAYVGDFVGTTGIHTDGVTEFSGNTLIPGKIMVRNLVADTKNNFFCKDSFIGVSMDVLCGPATTTTAFPFEQGGLKKEAAKGTLFTSESIRLDDVSACRNTDTVRLGRNTYLYIPTGYRARVFWAYYDTSGQLAYSGESTAVAAGLTKLDHSVYKLAMVSIAKSDGTAMTPADLLATGAKILGHISGSVTIDIRPESASGSYVMDKSSFIMNTDNFSLVTTQQRLLAGGMYNTNMHTKTDVSAYKPYGTFRNVERLEYTKYLNDSHRTAATRDTYISAYDCPLLRVDDNTYDTSLTSTGNLVLRRCIVPKAEFQNDVINGNTYEDLDFSYTNEDLGYVMTGYTRFISSHKQGIYRMSGGPSSAGFISHKGNLADTARLYRAEVYLPLDGDLVESGSYSVSPGWDYNDAKIAASDRVRMARPLATFGAVFPSMPTGYEVHSIVYLDSSFIITNIVPNSTSISTDDPYFILVFRKGGGNVRLPVNEFIALNLTLRTIDQAKAPEITGSAYVGAGCTVRGDVKLHGDPYVNRVFDVSVWERGTTLDGVSSDYPTWDSRKIPTGVGNRFRFIDTVPVEPGAKITCNSGYWITCYFFDANGNYISSPGWGQTASTAPDNAAFVGVIIKKATAVGDAGGLIEESDIPLANVKYVRAFKKRRYITNELDRTSPEDTFLAEDQWRVAAINTGECSVGKLYKDLIVTSDRWCILKRPFNMGSSWTIRLGNSVTYAANPFSWDALTKLLGTGIKDGVALTGLELGKKNGYIVTLLDVPAARIVLEFVPSPRIVVPYGSSTLFISGPKIRMYGNAVLSRNLNQEGEIVLSGEAVMGYDFNAGSCMCSNGHSDAIIKLP